MPLDGRQIIIAGGAGGIGIPTAELLAAEGARLILTYRSNAAHGERAAAFGDVLQCDLTVAADRARVLDAAPELYGVVILAGDPSRLPNFEDAARRSHDANYLGPIMLAREAAERMKQAGTQGAIVLTSTMQAVGLFPGSIAYAGAKAALLHAGRILAKEYRGHANIRVNVVSPGVTAAGMAEASIAAGKSNRYLDEGIVHRFGQALDVARAIRFFLEPDNYVTGQVLSVDGGLTSLTPMLIIDTHAHIYSPDEKKYPPIEKPLRPPTGKGSLEHLRAESSGCGVARACLIQTGTFYRYDNRYTADSAKANPTWTAGVCTLGPDNPQSPEILRGLVRDYGMKGVRSIPSENGNLDHDGVRAIWRAAADLGIIVNVLINRNNADALDTLLGEFASLRVVLDHSMNLKAGAEMQPILDAVKRVSRHRNLHAKVTCIPTGSTTGYPCSDMHEPCMQVIRTYGPDRCVWGSNFPCELWTPRVSYAEHLRIFAYDLPLSHAEREQVLGKTAEKLWFA